MGVDSAATMSLMMLVQSIPEAKPAKARLLLVLDVAAAIILFFAFFLFFLAVASAFGPSKPLVQYVDSGGPKAARVMLS
jgi:hypothetical protein